MKENKYDQFCRWYDWLLILLPNHWTRLYRTSLSWDRTLVGLMSEHTFQSRSEYRASLSGFEICVSNYPHASFTPNVNKIWLPRRVTVIRAMRKLKHDLTAAERGGSNGA